MSIFLIQFDLKITIDLPLVEKLAAQWLAQAKREPTPQELDEITSMALRINDFLSGLFSAINIRLVDFKLEFGRLWEGELMRLFLADEISPDGCRLWDMVSKEKMDKDRFREDLGGMVEAYQEVARRLGIFISTSHDGQSGPVLVS